jgi:hypothetical protein
MTEIYQGVLIDERPEAEKAKDWQFEELVSSPNPVNWVEKKPIEWRSFPIADQGRSGSCVAQTLAKMVNIHFWNETGYYPQVSASHIYQRRANRPSFGMNGHDAFKIGQQGITLEEFAPSQRLTDAQMDNLKVHRFMEEVGKSFALGQYLQVTPNIDAIASIIQTTGKGVMVWFYFSNNLTPVEWSDVPEVRHPLTVVGESTVRHSVVAVDFTLHKGKKALIIEDSWGLDRAIQGRRIITEDFFRARCYFAAHFMNFKFETPSVVTERPFLLDLELGMRSAEVERLQRVLQRLGHFPANVEVTGFYGNVTATAVGRFQIAQGIVVKGQAGFGRFGPMTRARFNSLIS